jgi:DNA-binding GntR family transcriptional regulator
MSNNASLLKVLRQLFENLYFKYRLEWLLIDRFTIAKEQHHLILKEMKEGNVAKAASCMKDHIKSGRSATLKGVRLAKRKIGF